MPESTPPEIITENEIAARECVSTPKKLSVRLRDAKAVLVLPEHAASFQGTGTLDFPNQRLISPDGKWALQWRLRLDPNAAESPQNQQSRRGDVSLVQLKKSEG